MKTFVVAFFLIGLFISVSFAQEQIYWLGVGGPPFVIENGKYAREGFCDAPLAQIHEYLPQYDNVVTPISFSRFLKLVKTKPNYCFTCFLKNSEREAYILFSEPYLYTFGNMLITRTKDEALFKPYLDADGRIDLKKLLASGKVTLSISYGRSYGTYIDDILLPYRETAVLIGTETTAKSNELMFRRLVTTHTYQAFISYPTEVVWHSTMLGIPKSEFKVYPISGLDVFDPRSNLYIGCSKGGLGKEVIETFNARMAETHTKAFKNYRQWLDDESLKLHKAYEPIFLKKNP